MSEATRRIVVRYIRQHPDSSVAEIAEGTGIPAYIVKRQIAASVARKYKRASEEQA